MCMCQIAGAALLRARAPHQVEMQIAVNFVVTSLSKLSPLVYIRYYNISLIIINLKVCITARPFILLNTSEEIQHRQHYEDDPHQIM